MALGFSLCKAERYSIIRNALPCIELNPAVEGRVHSHMTLTPGRLFVALGILFSLWPLSAYSRVWYVRNDGTGDAPTIQAAIDSAAAGDTITLAKGIFAVQSIIECAWKNDLTINSEAGCDNTSLSFGEEPAYMSVEICSDISLDGISFRNSQGSALFVAGSKDITISNCGFFNNGHYYHKYAVVFYDCDTIEVYNCLIGGNRAGIDYYELDNNIVSYNNTYLANTWAAIHLNDVLNCNISHSIISGSSYGITGFGYNLSIGCNDVFNNGQNYSIFQFPDPTGLNGNISVDPQFCSIDPVAYNSYFLQSDSPCAPGTHPSGYPCGLIGCKPVGCSTVGTEKIDWSKVKQLFK
jgi:hypothetical protein